jgi:hypothetical protein
MLLRAGVLLTFLISIPALYKVLRPAMNDGRIRLLNWQVAAGIWGLGILLLLVLAVLTWTRLSGRILQAAAALQDRFQPLKRWNLAFMAVVISAVSLLLAGPLGDKLDAFETRLFLFWLAVLGSAFFLGAAGYRRSLVEPLAAGLIFTGFGYQVAAHLPDISTYPFTLGWSEASRFYYASLYFSKSLYGIQVPPTVLHPTRYLMQSVPFLIPHAPLWLHRLWQVLLWVSTNWLAAWLLARRLKISDRLYRSMFTAWVFLYLFLGPVYYHLLVPVIVLLAWFDPRRFWRSLLLVLLASAWAGISRVNWFPVPGMLAAALYFLEQPVKPQPLWRNVILPILWALPGLAVAFGAQTAYALLSGNPTDQFTSSFSSDLLWYRLFPSATFPLGILPAALLVSLPLFYVLGTVFLRARRSYHYIRWLGLAAVLLVLFCGGLVVSAKIGGGSNLHNLDAYLVLLLVTGSYLYFGRYEPEPGADLVPPAWNRPDALAFLAAALLLPVYFLLSQAGSMYTPNWTVTSDAVETIKSYTMEPASLGGEILFISERQLLTFNTVPGIQLVPEYEKVFLMEMAMAGNTAYLDRFHNDLRNHRFAMIISEPLFTREKGKEETFGEENDAWVNEVSKPVLCYYRPKKNLLTNLPIDILVPRAEDRAGCP